RTERPARRRTSTAARRLPARAPASRSARRALNAFDRLLVGGAPLLRLVHGDDRAAERFAAQGFGAARHPHAPVGGARIFQQQAGDAVREIPQASEGDFDHHPDRHGSGGEATVSQMSWLPPIPFSVQRSTFGVLVRFWFWFCSGSVLVSF